MLNKAKANKYLISICLLALASLFVVLVAIGINIVTDTDMRIELDFDREFSADLTKMSDTSNYVVIGKYEKLERTWNMRRDLNDITKEAADDYVEGRLYKFTITEVVQRSEEHTSELQSR